MSDLRMPKLDAEMARIMGLFDTSAKDLPAAVTLGLRPVVVPEFGWHNGQAVPLAAMPESTPGDRL